VGLVATASHVPARWVPAAEIAEASGIPEQVLVQKFGVRGKYLAAPDEHVSDLAAAAGRAVLQETGLDPLEVHAVVYFGSTYKYYPVWQASPWVAHQLGCTGRSGWSWTTSPAALRLRFGQCATCSASEGFAAHRAGGGGYL